MTREPVRHAWDLLTVLVQKEFKVRYKSTVLGYVWSLLHPLAFASVFYLLFKVIVRVKVDNYQLVLITGLFPWQWFANALASSNQAFLGNASLIKKTPFPRFTLVLSNIVTDGLHFLLATPVILIFMFVYGLTPSWNWFVWVPSLALVQATFTFGVALVIATWNLFLRDLERLISLVTLLWFYVTPVLFPPEMMPEKYHWILYANPMASVIICWRSLYLTGTMPLDHFASASLSSVLMFAVGYAVYNRFEWRFAEIV